MKGFEDLLEQLKSESEKAIAHLQGMPEAQHLTDVFRDIQNAIDNKDIDKLTSISNGDFIKE